MNIQIRELSAGSDRDLWADMRQSLWPEVTREEHLDDITWMADRMKYWGYLATAEGVAAGFAEVSLRDYANGCTGRPVPFLEGIWVRPDRRRQNVGAALIDHISRSLVSQGFGEICSDALLENHASHAAHAGWGFTETERVVYFRKKLAPGSGSATR